MKAIRRTTCFILGFLLLSTLSILNTAVVEAQTSGLVAAYAFDESSGAIALDASGNGNNGTLTNGSAFVAGKNGNGIGLDGVNDYVAIGNMDVSGSALTISAWIKADDFDVIDGRIVSKATDSDEQDHYWMLSTIIEDDEIRLRFRIKTNGVTSRLIATSGALAANVWTHVAAVYDGSFMILYKDGIEVGRRTKTGSISTNSAVAAAIGINPEGYGPFHGVIDECGSIVAPCLRPRFSKR